MYTAARGVPASDVLQFLFESFYDCGGEVVVATSAELSRYLGDRRALIAVDDAELDREDLQRVMDVVASSTFLCACTERQVWGEGESFDVNGLDDAAAVTLMEREVARPLTPEEGVHHSRRMQVARRLAASDPAVRRAAAGGRGRCR